MVHPMKALLICLVQLKQGSTHDIASKAFGCSSMKMRRLINGFVKKVGMAVYNYFLAIKNIIAYCAKEAVFEQFSDCLEAIDIMFQKLYQRGNNNEESGTGCQSSTISRI